jgi:GrpB-like predicted nucleotidyltransferase (UPF0157 family)
MTAVRLADRRGPVTRGEVMALPDPREMAADHESPKQAVNAASPPMPARIELRDYDPIWPRLYAREAARIRSALGERVVRLEHAGSTSVPGLAAKPIIDIVLEVPDAAEEAAYLPALEAAGYVLRLREPDWFQHRLLKGPDTDLNLHVFSAGCPETDRMLLFRDWLRGDTGDRALYVRTKRELAARDWGSVQQYADAKTAVIGAILARAQGGDTP